MISIPQKKCTKCGNEFPATSQYFHNEKRRNGLRSICKTCHNADQNKRLSRGLTPEQRAKKNAAQRESRARHREEINARDRERNQLPARKEQRKVNQRDWYDNNREHVRNYHTEYRMLKPHMRKAQSDRRRALKNNALGSHTSTDILLQITSQTDKKDRLHCWWCGRVINGMYHVDHRVALSQGGTNWPNNLVISCPSCNCSKSDKSPQEWAGRLI